MKILVDTNIYVASMRFAGVKRKLIWKILEDNHTLVLTDFIIAELRVKFSEMYIAAEVEAALDNVLQFLGTGRVEVKTYADYADLIDEVEPLIRAKDAPILAATLLPDVEYLVTRDKQDFLQNEAIQAKPWRDKIKDPHELLAILT